jgi:hypothetical protein
MTVKGLWLGGRETTGSMGAVRLALPIGTWLVSSPRER